MLTTISPSHSAASGVRCATLVELLRLRSQHEPERIAYRFLIEGALEEESITYSELDKRARAIGARLQTLGAEAERALLLYPAGFDYLAAFFGCLYAGVVGVPAVPPHANRNPGRLAAMAADCGAELALTTSALASRLRSLASDVSLEGLRWLETDKADAIDADEWQQPAIKADSLAYLQYTSGSTAVPKGVMITHANVLRNSAYIHQGFGHTPESIALTWLPHFHDMGLVDGIIQPLFGGFTGLLMSPASFLQRPLNWLEAISRYQVTHTGGPNFAYDLCVRHVKEEQRAALDLSSWSVAYNGAEPVRADTLRRFADAFASCGFNERAFYPAYGLAEATLKVSGGQRGEGPVLYAVRAGALEQNLAIETLTGETDARLLVGSGRASGETEVLIVNPESLVRCAPAEVGEVWVSGPGVAAGYWNRPAETERTFFARLADTGAGPYLRTGDLGFMHEGELFITGRLKDLIIIRGRNHYPQDIELVVERCDESLRPGGGAAFAIEAGDEERLIVLQELEPRRSPDTANIIERIRAAVVEEFEVQPHAICLLKSGSIPRTSSGKVQRRAARAKYLAGELTIIAEWRAAPTAGEDEAAAKLAQLPGDLSSLSAPEIEAWLQAQLAARLRLDSSQVDVNRPLSAYGLDSLAALELAHIIETDLRISLPLSDFLQSHSLSQLAAKLLGLLHAPDANSPREVLLDESTWRQAGAQPLSEGQQALWFLHRVAPESTAYNIAAALRILDGLDTTALRRAFERLLERHPALRTTFKEIHGKAVQSVHERSELFFQLEDAGDWSADALDARLQEEAQRPFNLEHGPLLRVHLFERGAGEHVLLLVAHHIAVDFWSLAVLMHELGALYSAEISGVPAQLPELDLQFTDYVRWQHAMLESARGAELFEYWQKQLAGELPPLDLPLDHPRPPIQTFRGASENLRLDARLTQALKELSRDHDATLYTTLLAAFQTLLYRYTGQEELLVGSPTSGRSSAQFAGLVGYFVNPIVLRAQASGALSFEAFLAQVRRTVLDAFEHQDYPFHLLVKRLQPERDPARSPLFQAMFTLHKAHLPGQQALTAFALGEAGIRLRFGGLLLESMSLKQRVAQFELSLTMAEIDGELVASFEYNTDLFASSTIRRMQGHFRTLLEAIVADPLQRLSELALLTPAERRQLLSTSKAGEVEMQPLVHELFERQAGMTPDSTAVRLMGGEQVSYAELNARANQLARSLRARGVGPDVLVGLCVERSAEMLIGMLGILKAGGAYLPLDPAYPQERLAFMLEDAQAKLVVSEEGLAEKLPAHGLEVVALNADELEHESSVDLHVAISPGNMAYLIYTSGSTGRPKGVMVSHGALAQFTCEAIREYQINGRDRVLQFASFSFDASAEEIYPCLTTGAMLLLATPEMQSSATRFLETCREERLTVLDLPTAFWHELTRSLSAADWTRAADLRLIIIGGEKAQAESWRAWLDAVGERVRLVNTYGPTEATIVATRADLTPHDEIALARQEVPIGLPLPHVEAFILNEALQPVPVGVRGELYLGGRSLARGYLRRPELTAERFIPHPFSAEPGARLYRTGDLARYRADGQIEYAGRADTQLKIRGYRIEPGEIEAALRRHAQVRDAVVVADDDERGMKRLVAYIVPRLVLSGVGPNVPDGFAHNRTVINGAPTANELRAFLHECLPEYMIPSAFVLLDQMPLTRTGKLDRRRLPSPGESLRQEKRDFIAPRTKIEQQLCDIWSDVLKVGRVGVNDNFFELGGDSILSIQVIARAQSAGIRLAPRQIFERPTIAELAAIAETIEPAQAAPMQLRPTGDVLLTPIQHWFFEQDFDAPAHWNMALLLETTERLDHEALARAWSLVIENHDALRLRFIREENGWRQFYAEPDGANSSLSVVNLSHVAESEQRLVLEAKAAEAQRQLNLTHGPMLRGLLFDLGAERDQRLLIIIHHLVIDGVSWRILLEDLEHAYHQLQAGANVQLPPENSSFQSWAESLRAYAQSPAILEEAAYWSSLSHVEMKPLPVDKSGKANNEASARTITTGLSTAETRSLLQQVPAAYRTQINDLLLTALVEAFACWTGERQLLFELEGHGREELFKEIDLSRTIGWFTSAFPVLLNAGAPGSAPGETLKRIKEQLRSIAPHGTAYGVLRYMGQPDDARARSLRAWPEPEVSFNYLGQLDQMLGAGRLFRPARESAGPLRDGEAPRSRLIDINAYVIEGQLRLDWTYSEHVHERSTIERLAQDFLASLQVLIEHCLAPGAGSHTPSDFPLARLTQAQLDELLQERRDVMDIYPLSPMQQGILFHSLYEPHADLYVGQISCTLRGPLDAHAFERAWQHVVAEHPVLRTSFAWENLDEPLQLVHQSAPLSLTERDLRTLPVKEQWQQLESFCAAERARRFDLKTPPLMRLSLMRLDDEQTRFVWTHHHLLLDGWSLSLLLREVLELYKSYTQGVEAERGRLYRDYVAWLRRQDSAEAEAFWRERLANFSAPTPLVIDRAPARMKDDAEAQDESGQRQLRLTAETTARLHAFAREHGLTLSTLVQGAWAILLSRYSREDDVLFGATVSGRPPTLAGVHEMVGLFINTLPVRVRVSAETGLLDWLKRLQVEQARLRDYEYSPLVEVQGWSEVPRGQQLFESLLVFENYPIETASLEQHDKLRLADVRSYDRTNYPLTIIAVPGAELSLQALYTPARFDDEAIERMLGHLETLLETMPEETAGRVSDLPLMTEAERRRVLIEWNETEREFPRDSSIHEMFAAQVERTPERVALVHGEEELSYRELNRRANKVAHYLRKLGVGPEVRVGICAGRSLKMMVGLLGILKAGGAYVALDPQYPRERLSFMLEDSGARVLLTEQRVRPQLPPHDVRVVSLDEDWSEIELESDEEPALLSSGEHLAYIIYTSGSTGRPKGVAITHRSVVAFSHWARQSFDDSLFAGVLCLSSFCFDLSIFESFVPLHRGGKVILVENVLHISSLTKAHEVVLINTVPSAIGEILRLGHMPKSVRVVCLAGEPLPAKLVQQLYELPHIEQVFNLYGPTEDTTYSTWGLMKRASNEAPHIGRPLHNTRAYIIDATGQPVPVGVPGELLLGGYGLARGYLGRPDLTAERFVPDPFSREPGARLYRTGDLAKYLPDGEIDFLGRLDHQVKIRGYRIEPGEIEAVLGQHPSVRECAVLAREDVPGDKRLIAYVVPKSADAPVIELKEYLKQKLSEYMIPSAFVLLDQMPLTPNGKIDRKRLPAPEMTRAATTDEYIAPRNAVEEVLAGIWMEVLGVERVGAEDNFFDLGGHSLLATRVLSTIRRIFKMELPLHAVFEARSLAELARVVIGHEPQAGQAEKIARLMQKVKGLSQDELRARLQQKRREKSEA